MSKESDIHLSSGLGLACRIAVGILKSSGTETEAVERFQSQLLNALGTLSTEEAIRLRTEFAEGVEELTGEGRFQGRRKLKGRLTTIESHVVRDFLKTHGVDAQLRRVTDVTNPVFCVEVWVRPIHLDKAQTLMEKLTDSRGELIACAQCGEESPQGFGLCWNCGEELVAGSPA